MGAHFIIMQRIIIQNIDKVPDDVIGGIVTLGLPDIGVISYNTRVGEVCVAMIERRKSRVYQVWKPFSEDVLIDKFKV